MSKKKEKEYTFHEFLAKFTGRCLECNGTGHETEGIFAVGWCKACGGTGKRKHVSRGDRECEAA